MNFVKFSLIYKRICYMHRGFKNILIFRYLRYALAGHRNNLDPCTIPTFSYQNLSKTPIYSVKLLKF